MRAWDRIPRAEPVVPLYSSEERRAFRLPIAYKSDEGRRACEFAIRQLLALRKRASGRGRNLSLSRATPPCTVGIVVSGECCRVRRQHDVSFWCRNVSSPGAHYEGILGSECGVGYPSPFPTSAVLDSTSWGSLVRAQYRPPHESPAHGRTRTVTAERQRRVGSPSPRRPPRYACRRRASRRCDQGASSRFQARSRGALRSRRSSCPLQYRP
jgi:hypothetical protein